MATLSQMMNPQMMQMMQQAMQRAGGGGGMMRQGGGGGGMMRQAAPQPMGGNPQAQMLQQMAQRFGQPATTPQFDPRAYAAQQQEAQRQRWLQMMQQLQNNPGATPQTWNTPRTWGNTQAGQVSGAPPAIPSGPGTGDPFGQLNRPGFG